MGIKKLEKKFSKLINKHKDDITFCDIKTKIDTNDLLSHSTGTKVNQFQDFLGRYNEYFLNKDESNRINTYDQAKMLMEKVGKNILHSDQSLIKKTDSNSNFIEIADKETMPEAGIPLDQVYEKFSESFEGTLRRHATKTSYNIGPSPLLPTISANTVVNIYNPNCIMDEVCGNFLVTERKVVKMLCDLANIDHKQADGMSTFGGAGTLTYALKIAIAKAAPQSISHGIQGEYYVLTGETNHYVITSICGFLGIGTNKCIRVPSIEEGKMDLHKLHEIYEDLLQQKKQVVCIVANGGETINHAIDDLEIIDNIVTTLTKKYKVLKPHLHLDSVNGRSRLTFKDYEFEKNPLSIHPQDLTKIKTAYDLMKKVKIADSFSADFHKTGLCPYVSAFFIVRNYSDFGYILGNIEHTNNNIWGNRVNFKHSLEHSRSGTGIASAYIALQSMGTDGFQRYIACLLQSGRYIIERIRSKYGNDFEIVNEISNRFVGILIPKFDQEQSPFSILMNADSLQKEQYNNHANNFNDFCYQNNLKGGTYPLLGYIGKYLHNGIQTGLVVFKTYATSTHLNLEECEKYVDSLHQALQDYKQQNIQQNKIIHQKQTLK